MQLQEGQVWRIRGRSEEWTLAHIGLEGIIDHQKVNVSSASFGRRLIFRIFNTDGSVKDEMQYWENFIPKNGTLIYDTVFESNTYNRLSKVD
jgi:hypothetical protein